MIGNLDPSLRPRPDVIKIDSGEVQTMTRQLGPEGEGFYALRNDLAPTFVTQLEAEALQSDEFWAQAPDRVNPDTGEVVVQNFSSFDINFYRGSDSYKEAFPATEILRVAVDDFVHEQDLYFPGLDEWNTHSATFHRYPPELGELGWHRDLSRHPQIILTVCIKGRGVLLFEGLSLAKTPEVKEVPTYPGKIIVMRAPHLWNGADGSSRVRHRAVNAEPEERITATFRDNLLPDEELEGANAINVAA